ncbi:hypothetical protein ACFFMM_20775 [Micromonospora chaiyaphumensis]|uniref:Lipoprotein LprG n=1 Tax=Micromonospora chaiyaphumensis TaxID=307119 RepID=A0A1C4TWQ5_9ACTN|nr:hypothetical protein [Micromonospora chaiyaphumensis]SCE63826.1 hypothetical protein GA0070214_10156 [Micromonospora chaiyaphumensis]
MAAVSAGAILLLACVASARTGNGPAAPASTVSADATTGATTAEAIELLRSGTQFVDRTSFRADVDIASQVTTLSYVDNVHKRAVATVSASGQAVEIRMIGDEVYLRSEVDLPGVGHEWLALDPARVPADFALSFAPGRNDPGGSARLIKAIVTARSAGSQIVGTIDLTRVGAGNGITFRAGPDGFPDAARSNPFRATLDAEGRLVTFLIPAAVNGMPNASLRYSGFGAAVDVTRPQGAVAAPDALYPQLGLGG